MEPPPGIPRHLPAVCIRLVAQPGHIFRQRGNACRTRTVDGSLKLLSQHSKIRPRTLAHHRLLPSTARRFASAYSAVCASGEAWATNTLWATARSSARYASVIQQNGADQEVVNRGFGGSGDTVRPVPPGDRHRPRRSSAGDFARTQAVQIEIVILAEALSR